MPPAAAKRIDPPRGAARAEVDKHALAVQPRNPAAGTLAVGDVITGVNGDKVETDLDLFRAIDKYSPGESVTLKVARLRKDGGAVRRDRVCVHACEIVPQAGA